MLPPTFIVKIRDHDIPDFVCDKCSAKVTSKTVLNMIAQDEKEWQMLISSGCCNISTYKKILEKQRKILHEGHANIVNFKASILPRRMVNEQSLQQISDELLVEFMKYCKEVVENLKLLTPCEFQMYPFDVLSLRSHSHFAYLYNIYFFGSEDKRTRIMSVPIVQVSL